MKNLPSTLPVFPLSGVIYFPKTNLPLNIFEQRYLNLVNDAYNGDKLMGMVQSKKEIGSVYQVGCLGKISDYQKSRDGRILINLTGISRFRILMILISLVISLFLSRTRVSALSLSPTSETVLISLSTRNH